MTFEDWKMAFHNELCAPEIYWSATPAWIAEHSNGCGPGNWKIDLVPDEILGVDFSDACDIHDIMYGEGKTEQDKQFADRVLLLNILSKIDQHQSDRLSRVLQIEAAWKYYEAVSGFGDDAFWAGKKRPPAA